MKKRGVTVDGGGDGVDAGNSPLNSPSQFVQRSRLGLQRSNESSFRACSPRSHPTQSCTHPHTRGREGGRRRTHRSSVPPSLSDKICTNHPDGEN